MHLSSLQVLSRFLKGEKELWWSQNKEKYSNAYLFWPYKLKFIKFTKVYLGPSVTKQFAIKKKKKAQQWEEGRKTALTQKGSFVTLVENPYILVEHSTTSTLEEKNEALFLTKSNAIKTQDKRVTLTKCDLNQYLDFEDHLHLKCSMLNTVLYYHCS